jgi:hypothetical protein
METGVSVTEVVILAIVGVAFLVAFAVAVIGVLGLLGWRRDLGTWKLPGYNSFTGRWSDEPDDDPEAKP